MLLAFAGSKNQMQHFPLDQVADNKAHIIATSFEEAKAKVIKILHSAKLSRFVDKTKAWFQVTVSTEFDMDLLPHILVHFTRRRVLGIRYFTGQLPSPTA
jgi:hypothetical protein